MNKELKELKKIYQDLYDKKIYAYKLEIIDELECQLDFDISDEDYCKLYNEIEYAYLKVENIYIGAIVRCALDNFNKIINDDEDFDLREESCWY